MTVPFCHYKEGEQRVLQKLLQWCLFNRWMLDISAMTICWMAELMYNVHIFMKMSSSELVEETNYFFSTSQCKIFSRTRSWMDMAIFLKEFWRKKCLEQVWCTREVCVGRAPAVRVWETEGLRVGLRVTEGLWVWMSIWRWDRRSEGGPEGDWGYEGWTEGLREELVTDGVAGWNYESWGFDDKNYRRPQRKM